MERLTVKEQTLLAYYVCNFLEKGSEGSLSKALKEGLGDRLSTIQEELTKKGLLSKEDKMITNEGILYMDNTLHIQSYATEGNKLAYVKDSLQINEIELSEPALKHYIHQNIGIEQPSIH
ncbi:MULTISPECIES: hypothetical protein [unclassified Psychrobacillus]|uniref:hypothetical protein n=1 Tax=unclassified Psychrobacillus TaxID=2636677 RepID=UPI00146CA06F|nr:MULTISPECIES: hypothetical protein [unclassified Psychrobacillus]MCM3357450.1 hypothetical protein [Psychrobacillus sp. MER TA 171]NME04629.1 hypothetical protein [Psychrobacillus sp. BL-248-WT-3]